MDEGGAPGILQKEDASRAKERIDLESFALDAQHMGPGGSALTCLVVNNNRTLRAALMDMLEAHGIQVVGATGSGDRALGLVERLSPDVVIVDQRLGTTTGTKLSAAITALHPDCQVILYTSEPTRATVEAALAAGAREVIQKEASPANLLECLSRIRRSRRDQGLA